FDELHRSGMTILMVTHDDSIAERCQRIIRVRDGRVEHDETN
ncbi:MAG: macrolide ABC transporter ATP-binding protein, partial [Planctomycetes bacterium HGW-Planctomycetes-2]